MPSFEVSNNNKEIILNLLSNGERVDGRQLTDHRQLEINFNSKQYGYVEVSLGDTRCVARVSSEIVTPYEDRPFEGIFNIGTEITSMLSPMFENGRQSEDEIMISRMIEKAVRRSNALDLESLCIVAGLKCWAIRCDLHFLNYDGNFIDASCIAVMALLLHYRKPDITVEGDVVTVHSFDERAPVPLSVLHVPICVTFSFYNTQGSEENVKGNTNSEIVVVDATMDEESLRSGSLTVTLNKNKEIIQINKAGGLSIDALQLIDCCNLLSQQVVTITERVLALVRASAV